MMRHTPAFLTPLPYFAVSSNYNWPPGLGSGFDAIQMAMGLREKVSPLERDLIEVNDLPCNIRREGG